MYSRFHVFSLRYLFVCQGQRARALRWSVMGTAQKATFNEKVMTGCAPSPPRLMVCWATSLGGRTCFSKERKVKQFYWLVTPFHKQVHFCCLRLLSISSGEINQSKMSSSRSDFPSEVEEGPKYHCEPTNKTCKVHPSFCTFSTYDCQLCMVKTQQWALYGAIENQGLPANYSVKPVDTISCFSDQGHRGTTSNLFIPYVWIINAMLLSGRLCSVFH